ncbi:MAG: L,D-transpeptidase family protein [Candidatus Saccharimonadales bacterium]
MALICSGLLLCFILINVIVYSIFLHRTYPNTRIANFNIGATNYSDLSKKINSLALLPSDLLLEQHGKSSSVTPAQLGVQIYTTKIETSAKNRSWLPVENFFVPHNSSTSLKINKKILTNKLAALAALDKNNPTNAQIVIQNGQFLLSKSANGYQLNIDQSSSTIIRALKENKTKVSLPFTITTPSINDASLSPTLQQLQSQQSTALSYTYNGKVTKPSAATISGWYTQVNNGFAPEASKIQAYITQVGTSDGIQVQNISAAVAATQSALQKMSAMSFALVAVPPTVCSPNKLSQLILVNITQQHMWACQGSNLIYDSPVTTGAYLIADDATPTGTWHIYAKERNTHLIGPTWDDFVNYWLPFYSAYGFHDATWQTFPFGGDQYPTQGSHGCVHLPLAAMAWLYNWANIGTTVTITQ